MAVCSINYIDKTFPQSKAEAVAKLHTQVENDFISMGKGFIKASNVINKFVPVSYKQQDKMSRARTIAKQINSYYEKPVIKTSLDTKGRDFYTVNVADAFIEKETRMKSALEKMLTDPYVVIDGEVMNPSDVMYQRKANNLQGLELDTIEEFFKKAEQLQQVFHNKGVDVYVMLDGDQKDPGQVLAQGSTTVQNLTRQGVINEGTKVISVNPNLAFTDVVIHEFAHLYIDAIGGLTNTRVQNAFNKLIGTELYNRIKETYSDLDETSDKFKKEVLVTAMGEEGSKLFESDSDKNWWNKFKDWVFDRVRNILGIKDVDTARSLVSEMMVGQFEITAELSMDNYSRKANTTNKKLMDMIGTRITNLSEANQQIALNISEMVNTFQDRTGARISEINPTENWDIYKRKVKTSEQAFVLGKMKAINGAIKRLTNTQYEKYILSYVHVALEGINRNLRQLQAVQNQMNNDEDFDLDKGNKILQSIQLSNESFSLLEKLSENIDSFETSKEIKAELKQGINNALAMKNDTINKFNSVARELLVKQLAPMEGLILAEKKEQLEVEYNQTKTDPTGRVRSDETKDQFINRILTSMKENIEQETKDFVEENLIKSASDVGITEYLLRSEKSMNSMVVRLASRIMDRASFNYSKAFLEKRADMHPIFQSYADKYGGLDQKQMWSALTQEEDGELYLKSKYDYEFFKQYKKLQQDHNAVMADINSTSAQIQASAKTITDWRKENTMSITDPVEGEEVIIPKPKWLNREYSAIMSNPNSVEAKMLKALEQTLGQSDNNYNKKLKLVRSPFGNRVEESAVYMRIPAMGRDTLEKAFSGDYLTNAQDSLERLVKYKEDDVERFGKATEEAEETDGIDHKLIKRVMGSTQGSEKHNIPIYFRGKFDTKLSTYDIMTAIMSDHYMSLQYKEKAAIQPLLEVLTTVTANKEFGETAGFKNLNKMIGGTIEEMKAAIKLGDNSLEYAKLKSMIENRLYNITTLESEAGKVAQTVMAWTGSVMMSLNFFSGIANVMQGKVMNFLESVGGNLYDQKNLTNGEKKFFADMGGWLDDLGTANNQSKTRLMIEMLNVQGDFIGLKERYIRSNRALALASRKTLTAPNTMGEFYVQATLMYAMMDNIKVRNKDGQYLTKEGKPTTDIKQAISLDEAMTVKDGKLVVDKNVYSTSFSNTAQGDTDKILEETRALVKKVSSDLHGQYDKELQAHAQRSIWGKMGFMFRKWLVPGFDKRWRGTANVISFKKEGWQTFEELRDEDNRKNRFFSSDLKQFQEGRYTTFIRMMTSLAKDGEAMALATMSLGNTNTWNLMTDAEKSNVKQTATEFAIIVLTLASAYILKGLAEDIPEDDPAYTALMLSAFASRRLHMELIAFTNPAEALALMQSPAASVSIFQKSFKLVTQLTKDSAGAVFMGEDFDRYDRGDLKDQLKIQKYFFDLVPVINQTNRSVDDAVTFLFQNY